ncbi:MAG: hypothetical protein U5K43_05115 [Halofilum sp. (in: g-proteobacteria)]|nr:hypothetical protein [Halofilum sp. (in: g-proteobacteria)]
MPELVVAGELMDVAGDYRGGVERFDAFLAALRAEGAFAAPEVLAAPFALDPATGITGDSGTAGGGPPGQAAFRLRLQGDPDDGA